MIWLLIFIALEIAALAAAVCVVGTRIQYETEGIAQEVKKAMDEVTRAVIICGTEIRVNTEEAAHSNRALKVLEDLAVVAHYNRKISHSQSKQSRRVEIPWFSARWIYETGILKRRGPSAGKEGN